jgi:hypothetical protein
MSVSVCLCVFVCVSTAHPACPCRGVPARALCAGGAGRGHTAAVQGSAGGGGGRRRTDPKRYSR